VLYIDTYNTDTIFDAFVNKRLERGIDLPRTLRLAVVSRPKFHKFYSNVQRYSYEVEEIKRNRDLFGAQFTERLLEEASELLMTQREELSTTLNTILNDLNIELTKLEDNMRRMRFEIEDQNARRLEKQIASTYDGKVKEDSEKAGNQQTANLLVGDNYQTWPFEGEFWADEINNYRSYLTNLCVEEE